MSCQVTEQGVLRDGRYRFQIEGESPRSVALTDLGAMLEARFSGEVAMRLDASREQKIQDVREKYEKSAAAAGLEKQKLQQKVTEYEALRVKLEAEYQEKLGNVSKERADVEEAIRQAKARLEEAERAVLVKKREVLDLVMGYGDSVQVTPDLEAKVEVLLLDWQNSLEEYATPLPVEWAELATQLAKLIGRVVQATKTKVLSEGA